MASSMIHDTSLKVQEFGLDWNGYRMPDGTIIAWKMLSGTADITKQSESYGGYHSGSITASIPSGLFSDASSMIVIGNLNSFEGTRLSGARADSTTTIGFILTKAISQTAYKYKLGLLVIGK